MRPPFIAYTAYKEDKLLPAGWGVFKVNGVHVAPAISGGLLERGHTLSTGCVCNPRVTGDGIVVHNEIN